MFMVKPCYNHAGDNRHRNCAGPDGEPKTFNNVTTLMGNLGLFIKSDESVEMYVWENVFYMKWTDVKARTTIWEEALAELIADAFEDEWTRTMIMKKRPRTCQGTSPRSKGRAGNQGR